MWFSSWSSHVADVSYLATTVIAGLFTKTLERAGRQAAGGVILEIMGHQENCNNEG